MGPNSVLILKPADLDSPPPPPPPLPQVLGSSSNNPVLILVGVPLIPVAFVTLEAMDVEAR